MPETMPATMPATTPDEPFCLAVSLLVRAGSEKAAMEHLRALVEQTRREPGNLIYNAHRSLEDPRRFLIYELYRDQAALETHRTTPHFATHGAAGLYPLVEERTIAQYGSVAIGC